MLSTARSFAIGRSNDSRTELRALEGAGKGNSSGDILEPTEGLDSIFRRPPITAAIVLAGGLMQHSKITRVQQDLSRVEEVLLGCLVGLVVSWLASQRWPRNWRRGSS